MVVLWGGHPEEAGGRGAQPRSGEFNATCYPVLAGQRGCVLTDWGATILTSFSEDGSKSRAGHVDIVGADFRSEARTAQLPQAAGLKLLPLSSKELTTLHYLEFFVFF